MKNGLLFLLLIAVIFPLIFPPIQLQAYTTGMNATYVIGQSNFTNYVENNNGGAVSAAGFNLPTGIVTNGTKLIVSDQNNHRILIYNTIPTSNNASADVVIGQTNMTNNSINQGGSAAANTLRGPGGLALVGNKLIVADRSNHRVLIYNSIPTSNDDVISADVVIGQPDMTTVTSGTSSTKLNFPFGVSYDSTSGKLVIADGSNNRVLIYNSVPTSNGAAADVVVGQANMTSSSTGTTATTLGSFAYSGRIFSSKLFVSDFSNNRVLIYDPVPTSNGEAADVVVGQPDMTSVSANQGGAAPAANTLYGPTDMFWDDNNFFIFDGYDNNRILIFSSIPTSNNASATKVFGQTSMTATVSNTTQSNLRDSDGLMYVYNNKLYIGDDNANRVLIVDDDTPPTPTPTPTRYPTPVPTANTEPKPPTCGSSKPGDVANVYVIDRIASSGQAEVRWIPPSGGTKAHIRYTDKENLWLYALLNTDNDGSEIIKGLVRNHQYWFSIAGVNDCAVGEWSAAFGPVPNYLIGSTLTSPTPISKITPTPTCTPKPACLDASAGLRQCYVSEPVGGWCPTIGNIEELTPTPTRGVISPEEEELPPEEIGGGIIATIGAILGTAIVLIKGWVGEFVPDILVKNSALISTLLILPTIIAVVGPAGLSLGNLWYYLTRFIVWLRGIIYFSKKRRPWGVVYNGLTKNPISGAIVRLYSADGKLIETEVTGKTGAFSFLPKIGHYSLKIAKPGFVFPSGHVTNGTDGEYNAVYHGKEFEIKDLKSVINFSIPLDPIDYHEGIINKFNQFIQHQQERLELTLVSLGSIASLIAAVNMPSAINYLILGFYGFIFLFVLSQRFSLRVTWGQVVNEKNQPVPQITLSLLETEFNRLVQRRVTDFTGRYQFVAPRGEYKLLITSPEWELVPQAGSFSGETLKVSKNEDLLKPKIVVKPLKFNRA